MALPDIMSLFRSTPAPVQAQPGQPAGPTGVANPGQPLPQTQQSPATDNNGLVPNQGQNPNAGGDPGNSDQSPLAQFSDIWKTANTPNDPTPGQYFANLDPAKVMESAAKVDFTKAITPEMMQQIQAGGPEAMAALVQGLNKVAQMGYAQSAIATTKIVEQALTKAQESYDARIPSMVRKLSANDNLQAENPLLSNPAVQPLVGALQEQLIRKNPNATSREIQQQVSDYFAALGTTFAAKPAETLADRRANKAAQSEDWDSFLG